MRTLTAALEAAVGGSVTKPGFLVQIDWSTPARLSSRGTFTWNSQTWTSAAIDTSGVRVDNIKVSGTLELGNADNQWGAMVLTYGIAGIPITVYGFDAGAVAATDDVVLLASAVGGKAAVGTDKVKVSLREATSFVYTPRTYVRYPDFTVLIPAGTTFRVNDQIFKIER